MYKVIFLKKLTKTENLDSALEGKVQVTLKFQIKFPIFLMQFMNSPEKGALV